MIQGKITEIGNQAVDAKEPILIFFDTSATKELRPYAVIQDVAGLAEVNLGVGSQITFGEATYQVTAVGNTANQNLREIQHASFIFDEQPAENRIANGVYLTPSQLPELSVGMTIRYA